MLSYLHSFHAGNHADILKHITLLYTLEYYNRKDKPYSVFDTHSGRALYELNGKEALKTSEASKGIGLLLEKEQSEGEKVPSGLKNYIEFVKKLLENGFYPGSPCFERYFIKKGCSLFLTELHKTEFSNLCENLKHFENFSEVQKDCTVRFENKDGFAFLKSSVPPVIKRGLILCDPSYEEKTDYTSASEILSTVHKKWSGASILLWYPLLSNRQEEIENMKQTVLTSVKNRDFHTEVLDVQFMVDTSDSHIETSLKDAIGSEKPRLYGSGMFVVNPCWGLDEHLKNVLPYLSGVLGRDGNGNYSVQML